MAIYPPTVPKFSSSSLGPVESSTPLVAPALPVWIAQDPASLKLLELVRKVASTASTVLIQGESGTGKDVLAQLVHFLSSARHEPLVKIDCASLPADLLESELFGYEKGAFTGATQAKPGRLEMAGRGTLILDEIAALSLPLQTKLLRVIEERTFERLGGHNTVRIQARLITLTNVDLERAVASHAFREDLYYRLFVLPIAIPPLRERRQDILPLAHHFLDALGAAHRRPGLSLNGDAREALLNYAYPGNVRELRNLVERAVIYGANDRLAASDFPSYLATSAATAALNKSLEQIEREHIEAVLRHNRGKKSRSAGILGISRKTLLEKRKRYQLD